jgi:hypothetical protein
MENNIKIFRPLFIIFLVFFLHLESYSQLKLKIHTQQVFIGDTVKMDIYNCSKRTGYYNISWELFINNKWGIMKSDIFNDFPKAFIFQKILGDSNSSKYFVVDNIFTGTFSKYKKMKGRLVLNYSYSAKLEPRRIIYSEKFNIMRKLTN